MACVWLMRDKLPPPLWKFHQQSPTTCLQSTIKRVVEEWERNTLSLLVSAKHAVHNLGRRYPAEISAPHNKSVLHWSTLMEVWVLEQAERKMTTFLITVYNVKIKFSVTHYNTRQANASLGILYFHFLWEHGSLLAVNFAGISLQVIARHRMTNVSQSCYMLWKSLDLYLSTATA